MTNPTPAVQLEVLVDVLDAADPRIPDADREHAGERAYDAHPGFAYASAIGLTNMRDQYGDDALADVIGQMRAGCAEAQLWTEPP